MLSYQNKKSLVHDEIIDGRTFYNDFVDKIATNSYDSLGLTSGSSPLTKKDNNIKKDIIKIEEAKQIADEIINNKDYSKILDKELTNYFVGFLRNQWSIGKKNRPNPTKERKTSGSKVYRPGTL